MTDLLVRNLDETVLAGLKRKAAEHGRALEDELQEILTAAIRPDRAELLAQIEAIRAVTPPHAPDVRFPSAEQMIREDRDR
jgi:antitoxin FitA